MSIQYINTGTAANKGNGDTLRLAFTKINQNFAEIAGSNNVKGSVGEVISNPSLQRGISVTYNTVTQYASFLVNIANTSTLGGVKVGNGISVDGTGVISAFDGNYNNLANIPQALGTTDSPTFNNVHITGNVDIAGQTTIVNSTVVTTDDLTLTLAHNSANAAASNGAGIIVNGPVTPASITYNSDNDSWVANKPFIATNISIGGNNVVTANQLGDITFSTNVIGTSNAGEDLVLTPNSTGTLVLNKISTLKASGTIYQGTAYDNIEYTDTSIRVDADTNSYAQMIMKNHNAGDNASTDLVILNDSGNDFTNLIDLGINSSGYNQSAYSVTQPGDGYLFTDGGNLVLGTQSPGKAIIFHAGGTTTDDAGGSLTQYAWTFNRRVTTIVNQPARLDFLVQNTSNNVEASSYYQAQNDLNDYIRMGVNSSQRVDGNILQGEAFLYPSSSGGTFHIGNHSNINFYTDPDAGYTGTPTLVLNYDQGAAILDADWIPNKDNTYNLGNSTSTWQALYLNSTSTVAFGTNQLALDNSGNVLVNSTPILGSIEITGATITSKDTYGPLILLGNGVTRNASIQFTPESTEIDVYGSFMSGPPNTYDLGGPFNHWRGVWVGTDGIQFLDGSSLTSANSVGAQVVVNSTGTVANTGTLWYSTIDGRLYVGYDGTFVDTNPSPVLDLSTVTQNIIPGVDLTYDLGSPTNQWRSLYVGTSTIYFGGVPLTVDTLTNTLLLNGSQITGGSATTSTLVNGGPSVTVDSNGVLSTPNNVISSGTVFATGLNTTGQIVIPNNGVAGGLVSQNGQGNIYFNTDNSLNFIVDGTYQHIFNADGTIIFGGGYIFPNTQGTQGQILVYDPSGSGDYTLRWQNPPTAVSSLTNDIGYITANYPGTFESTGLQVNGNAHVTGNLQVDGVFTFTGTATVISVSSATFFGNANGFGAFYAGVVGYTPLPYTVAQFTANYGDYSQINFQNLNNSATASTDWVATADNGSDSTNFIDLGIAGSNWNGTQANSLGTALGANDAYLYAQGGTGGGNLVLGTTSIGKAVKILAGQSGAAGVVAQFNANGLTLSTGTGITFPDGTQQTSAVSSTGTVVLSTLNVTNLSATNITINGQTVTAGISTATVNALIANSLTNYATQSYVTGQGYLTSSTVNQYVTSGISTASVNALIANSLTNYVKIGTTANFIGTGTASSTNTGILQVQGGAGISGNLYANTIYSGDGYFRGPAGYGNISLASGGSVYLSEVVINGTGLIKGPGGSTHIALLSGTGGSVKFYNTASIAGTTSATSTTTGALVVSGGIGVGGDVYVGGTVTANKFVGDGSSLTNVTVTQQANIVGVQPNVTLVAGSYSYVFDNTSNFTMPTNGDIIVPGASGNINVGNTVSAAQTGTSGGYAFIAGPGATSQVALGLQGTTGTAANMAIRDNSTVASSIYYDVSIGGASHGMHQFRGTSGYTQYAQIDRYGINLPTRPAFRVYGAGTTNNLSTTVNTNGILNGNNYAVDYQQSTALNTSTGVFTAPVAGLYSIHLNARVYNNTAPLAQVIVIKNYNTSTSANMVMWESGANPSINHFGVSTIAKLAVGDTLVAKVTVGSINFDANDSWAVAYIG